jgi:DNA-binding response OmpR family regulator
MRATRILWADDQIDIARTLSALLSPLAPEIVFASDASMAADKLSSGRFDLVVADLAMPPGEWGGLWLLAHMSAAGSHVPVLVLSGEGSQAETIKALRLGARDYVTKDAARTELLSQVRSVLRDEADRASSQRQEQLPTPLAIAYRRFTSTGEPVAALRRLLTTYEMVARWCGVCGMACAPAQASPPAPLAQLRAPSLGTWIQVVRWARKNVSGSSPVGTVLRRVDWNSVERVVPLRNRVAHGGDPSDERATYFIEDLRPELDATLDSITVSGGLKAVAVSRLEYDGEQFVVRGVELRGHSTTLPQFRMTATQPAVSGHTYLVEGDSLVEFSPLVETEPGSEPATWRVLIFDGLVWDGQGTPTGDEQLRYIESWSTDLDVRSSSGATLSRVSALFRQ